MNVKNRMNYRLVLTIVPLSLMTITFLILAFFINYMVYQSALDENKQQLIAAVNTKVKLIESLAHTGNIHSVLKYLNITRGEQRVLGKTGEILLLEKDEGSINLLMNLVPDEHQTAALSLDFGIELSDPVKRSFYESGFMMAVDDRGEEVLAAYAPVKVADEVFGLVAKIDRSEINQSINDISENIIIVTIVLLLLSAGCQMIFFNPFVKRLDDHWENLQEIIDSTNHGIFLLDTNFNMIFFSQTCCHLSGFSHEELESRWPLFIPDNGVIRALLNDTAVGLRDDFKIMIKSHRKDGSLRVFEFYGKAKRHLGRFDGVIGTVDDVTVQQKQAELLRETQSINRIGGWEIEGDSRAIHWNDEVYIIHGIALGTEISHENSTGMYHQESKKKIERAIVEGFKTGSSWVIDLQMNDVEGEIRWIRSIGKAFWEQGRVYRLAGTVQDITEQKLRELKLSTLSRAVEQGGSSVVITNQNGIIEYVNPQFTHVTGYTSYESIGMTPKLLSSKQTPKEVHENLWSTIKQGKDWRGEIYNQKKDGDKYWSRQTISPVKNEQGEISHFVSVSDDVTTEKENQEKMEKMAFYDVLTGLANRGLFKDRLLHFLQLGSRRQDEKIALLLLDLDKFKRINDTLGHDVGDELLKVVSRRLESIVRETDLVARLGGDEFVIILSELKGTRDAGRIAEKIIESLTRPIVIDGHEIVVTTSIGITIAPDDSVDEGELMKNADLAMYRAKKDGRNQYCYFTDEMQQEARQRLSIEHDLRDAIINEQFELYIQPKFDLSSMKQIGGEVLIRWNHPERGQVSPLEFISVAEETGMILSIGQWVVDHAFKMAKDIEKQGLSQFVLSINLSAYQLNDPLFVDFIATNLKDYDLLPRCIEFEITETLLMHNIDSAAEVMGELKKLGVKISIDDFGTGYSSLNYLKRLPYDVLKIDRGFVMGLPDDVNDRAIISSITTMATKMDVQVIAEGIETQEQLQALIELGCHQGQGYLFARPMSYADFLVYQSPHLQPLQMS